MQLRNNKIEQVSDRNLELIEAFNSQPYFIELDGFNLVIDKDVFPPDIGYASKFLAQVLKKYKPEVALDMGSGSGYLAFVLRKIGVPFVTAIDNHSPAIDCIYKNIKKNPEVVPIRVLKGDLFKPLDEEKIFDLIVFNHPYYPYTNNHIFGLEKDGGKVIIESFLSLAGHERVKKWQKYQNNNENEDKRELQFNVGEGNLRISPEFSLYWLYLFTPFLENEKSLNIPHVLFIKMQKLKRKKSVNLDEDTITSFAGIYFNDETFQRFWNRQEQIWCNGSKDFNEMDWKTYVHNITNLIYPVTSYSVNLELGLVREKLAREHEAKKSLEREINKERMFNHIYIPVFYNGLGFSDH